MCMHNKKNKQENPGVKKQHGILQVQRVAPAWRSVRSKLRLVSRRRGASNSTVGARRRSGDAARGFLGGPGGVGGMGSPGSRVFSKSAGI